jgi:Stigma-specific protein, Stig1
VTALRTLSTLCLALLVLAGCGSPLVGLECQDGYQRCGGSCYDFSSDEQHCGGCNISCNADQHCAASSCVAGPEPDAGVDGSVADAGDANIDASQGDGGGGEAGPNGTDPEGGTLPDGAALDNDATPGDGSTGSTGDGSTGSTGDGSTGSTGDGSTGDGSTEDDGGVILPPVLCTGLDSPGDCVCGIGLQKCSTTLSCVDLTNDNANCGACDNVCMAGTFCNLGQCDLICSLPTTFCNGQCIDFASDDANCGSCGNACGAAAQCIDSMCVGAAVGHVVAIGHDMSGVLRPAIRQLVGNSVFLAQRSPVRVLAYDAATSLASRTGVSNAIAAAAASVGRAYILTTAVPEIVTQQLGAADVFVIEPQQGATDAQLGAAGTMWSAALSDFVDRGGVVLMFDGGPDTGDMNQGTWQVLRAASAGTPPAPLLDIHGTTFLSQRILSNVRPGDAVAAGVSTEYQSQGVTVGFDVSGGALNHNLVIRDIAGTSPSGLPVVVHVVLAP